MSGACEFLLPTMWDRNVSWVRCAVDLECEIEDIQLSQTLPRIHSELTATTDEGESYGLGSFEEAVCLASQCVIPMRHQDPVPIVNGEPGSRLRGARMEYIPGVASR